MENPERAAAILALHLIEAQRRSILGAFLNPWSSRARFERLAESLLGNENLPVDPKLRYSIAMIMRHLEDIPDDAPLPSEQEIVDWIAARGGLSALHLEFLRDTRPKARPGFSPPSPVPGMPGAAPPGRPDPGG
jgi:hypothetical protein